MSVSVWDIVAIGEFGLAFIALKVIWIVTLVTVRRQKDALRLPFLWLKWAIPLFLLYVSLSQVGIVIVVVNTSLEDVYDDSLNFLEASARIFDVAALISSIADMFLLLCLVELALSFLRALGNDGIFHKTIRYSSFSIIVVLLALAVAAFGEDETYTTQVLDDNNVVSWNITGNLYSAYNILYWITSLGTVVLSSMVLHISLEKKNLRSLTRRFLAASLLNLIRATWEFSYAILYEINWSPYTTIVPEYVGVVDPILYTWVTISIFGLLMAIGFKKRNGLWSEQQLSPQAQFMEHGNGGPIVVNALPVWKQGVTGSGSPGYWTQYQQPPQFVQNQYQAQNSTYAPTPMQIRTQSYRELDAARRGI